MSPSHCAHICQGARYCQKKFEDIEVQELYCNLSQNILHTMPHEHILPSIYFGGTGAAENVDGASACPGRAAKASSVSCIILTSYSIVQPLKTYDPS